MADGLATLPYEVLGKSHDRARWLQLRRSGVGASESAGLLNESPWLSAVEVYATKVVPDYNGDPDLEDAEHVYWGNRLEAPIALGYQDRTQRPVEHQGLLLRSRECPEALCTLDALTTDGRPGAPWPLEIKNIGVQKAEEWAEGPPRHYVLQLQHQMLVTGAPRATAAALIGGQRLVWCDVERDEIEIRRIKRVLRIFWTECVEAGVCPKADGSESSRRALGVLYSSPDPEAMVQLPGSFLDLDHELGELKLSIKALEKRRATIENEIKGAIGNAGYGVLPGGASYSWKEQTRAEHVVQASTFRVLRRHASNAEKQK